MVLNEGIESTEGENTKMETSLSDKSIEYDDEEEDYEDEEYDNNTIDDDDDDDERIAKELENRKNKEMMYANYNSCRILGWQDHFCGYCSGKRAHVLNIPHDEKKKNNNNITTIQQQHHEKENESESMPSDSSATIKEKSSSSPSRQVDSDDKKSNSSKSYSASFCSLTPSDYQTLLDDGWRRSGRYLYKPDNWNSCCPNIPIRLNTKDFRISKSQKKVWKYMSRYFDNNSTDAQHEIMASSEQTGLKPNKTTTKTATMNENQMRKKARMISPKAHKSKSDTSNNSNNDKNLILQKKIQRSLEQNLTLFEKLQNMTHEILEDMFKNVEKTNDSIMIKKEWCKYKLRKGNFSHNKINNKKQQQPADSDYDVVITTARASIFSTVCAAIAGRYHSILDIDRTTLVQSVCIKLKETIANSQCFLEDSSLQVSGVTIEPHLESGHINIGLNVNIGNTTIADQKAETESKSTTSGRAQKSSSTNITGTGTNTDVIYPKLTVKSVPSDISGRDKEVQLLYAKYQHAIHGDENPFDPDFIKKNSKNNHNTKSGDEGGNSSTTTAAAAAASLSLTEERIRISLKQNECIELFRNFLCTSPLSSPTNNTTDLANIEDFECDQDGYDTKIPYGSYHQQYRLNGKLIAVGVVDILPNCLSSVYSFYDPDLSKKMNLGKFTALREIEWVKRASLIKGRESLKYYYLGFYIHSCQKMRYKAEYKPSFLLCPTFGEWVDFEIAKRSINEKSPIRHCCAFSGGRAKTDTVETNNSATEENSFLVTDNPGEKKIGAGESVDSLVEEEAMETNNSVENDNTNINNKSSSSSSPSSTTDKSDSVKYPDIQSIKLDLGQAAYQNNNDENFDNNINAKINYENLVCVSDLTDHGRNLVCPHIQEFSDLIGNDVLLRTIIFL